MADLGLPLEGHSLVKHCHNNERFHWQQWLICVYHRRVIHWSNTVTIMGGFTGSNGLSGFTTGGAFIDQTLSQ